MTVVALAGRRIDAADAKSPRFPRANAAIVQERIRRELERLAAGALVCSAACGADLVALAAAAALGLKRRVVLPFAEARFRETSVVDRGAEWGPRFDQVVAELRGLDDLVTLHAGSVDRDDADEEAGYAAANTRILDEAQSVAARTGAGVVAVLVWEGESRGTDDLTEAFGREARVRRLPVVEVLTR